MVFSEGYLKKMKTMPPKILIRKIYSKFDLKIYHFLRERKIKRNGINLGNQLFKSWSSNMTSLIKIENKNYYNDFLESNGVSKDKINEADKICNHIFNLLGSGDTQLGKEIKWNQDFKTGFYWENKYYYKIKKIDLENDADIKVPWELSRFQYIPTLGQAYWLTSDEKYAEEFKNQIIHWIDENPFEMSVNWTCAMDVAIRACNWIFGMDYFKNSQSIDEEFWTDFNCSLYMHGEFIFNNLEKGEVNNNHYISNLVGLIWLGVYFRNLNEVNASKWLEFGITELEVEIEKQVYKDGFNYEASSAYHCFVTELLLYTSILCDRNNIKFSDSFNQMIEKMSEVIMNITKCNGLIPQIGDMDSGRFIILTDYGSDEKRDFRYLLGVSGQYFEREDFKYHASNTHAALWLFDTVNEDIHETNHLKSITYPQGGIHIMRNNQLYLLIRCGEIGTAGRGGHSHNDQLSIELNIDGEDFIVDPGTYVYTSDYMMRNKFRSTSYHSTLQIDNLEQNNFGENMFLLENESRAKVLEFGEHFFSGEHYGFSNKNRIIRHQREISISNQKEINIYDYVNDKTEAKKILNFILSPEIVATIKNEKVILIGQKYKIVMTFRNAWKINIETKYYSKAYGVIEKTNSISVETNGGNTTLTNIVFEELL